MDPFMIILIIAAALAIAVVWVLVQLLSMTIRTAVWGAKLPFRLGAALGRLTGSGAPRPRRCSNRRCVAELPSEARFCGRCGTSVDTFEPGVASHALPTPFGLPIHPSLGRLAKPDLRLIHSASTKSLRLVTDVRSRPAVSRFA